jgi:cytochrome c5
MEVTGTGMKNMRWVLIAGLGFLALACSQAEDPPASTGSATSTVAAVEEGTAAKAVHPGEKTYQNYCFSCHTPGLSGAPKTGDTEAWAPRIAKGADLLLATTIEGIPPAMPPRGMCFDCSDEDLAAAIDYMVQKSQ